MDDNSPLIEASYPNPVNSVNSIIPEEPARRGRRLTTDEAEKVKQLIGEGMDPALARAEVLGEEADL